MELTSHEKAQITERIAEGEPAQKDSERLLDSLPKQNAKSEFESKKQEEIATEIAVRKGE